MTVERKGSGKADVRCSFFIPYFQVGSNKELLTLQKDSLHDFLGKRIMGLYGILAYCCCHPHIGILITKSSH